MELQKTFTESYMKSLKDSVKAEESIPLYRGESFNVDNRYVKKLANVYAPTGLAEKLSSIYEDDYLSAIAIYEAYENISPLLATNEAFWAYLTHVDLFEYTQKRWSDVFEKDCSSNFIIDHWFVGSNGLLRNAIASQWWSVYNTIDPSREDKYELTKILYKNYTLRVVTFGSYPLIRHKEAMIGILSFLKDNPVVTDTAFEIRGQFLLKYFNRIGAVKQLAYLNRDYFYKTCSMLLDKILMVTKREQLKNEALYNDIM